MNTNDSAIQTARNARPRDIITAVLLLLLCMPALARAADSGMDALRISLSQSGPAMTTAATPNPSAEITSNVSAPLIRFGYRGITAAESSPTVTRAQAASVSTYPSYWIYSAHTDLLRDADGDGYFQRFRVTFDADVDYGVADVYARVYLSLDGGPWNLYYTTSTFSIYGTSPDDPYTVETTLTNGYPWGYYDVLIELYDNYSDALVTFAGPLAFGALSSLPLEDQNYDDPYYYQDAGAAGSGSGGGGTFGGREALLLGVMVVWRARRLRAH